MFYFSRHFNSSSFADHNVVIYKASDVNDRMMSQLTCGVGGATHRLQVIITMLLLTLAYVVNICRNLEDIFIFGNREHFVEND